MLRSGTVGSAAADVGWEATAMKKGGCHDGVLFCGEVIRFFVESARVMGFLVLVPQ